MTAFALTLVLIAAVLHALWNAIIKIADDRAVGLAMVSTMHMVAGLVMMAVFGLPAPASWPYLIASVLIHYAYYVFLFISYRLGDLSQVYPISRGVAPVLVALGASAFAGDTLSAGMWTGIVVVSLGIAILSAAGWATTPRAPVLAALTTGLIIAAYSVIDGIGVRLSQNPFGYIGWLFAGEFPISLFVIYRRRNQLKNLSVRLLVFGIFGGMFSVLAYALVLYTKTIAPIGAVSAVRESSVIVAALIGTMVLGEHHWRQRVGAAVIVGMGIVIIASSG